MYDAAALHVSSALGDHDSAGHVRDYNRASARRTRSRDLRRAREAHPYLSTRLALRVTSTQLGFFALRDDTAGGASIVTPSGIQSQGIDRHRPNSLRRYTRTLSMCLFVKL